MFAWSPEEDAGAGGFALEWGTASATERTVVDIGPHVRRHAIVAPELNGEVVWATVSAVDANGRRSESARVQRLVGTTGPADIAVDYDPLARRVTIVWRSAEHNPYVTGFEVSWTGRDGLAGTTVVGPGRLMVHVDDVDPGPFAVDIWSIGPHGRVEASRSGHHSELRGAGPV